ncbi:MAG: T9SS type A sorting domain-containing protein, partial [Bacteroidetes bacterium]|nr:T9SS type A sorting domain-containing protein [Bacteroidota bacterium]
SGINFNWISHYHYESNYPPNNVYGFIPDIFKIANNAPIFVAVKGSFLYHYTFFKDKILFIDSSEIGINPNAMLFSENDKFIILASQNHSIGIYDIEKRNIIREFILLDSVNAEVLVNLNGTYGFLAGNNKGKVKLFESASILSNVQFNIEEVSPNPSSDKLYIRLRKILSVDLIQIYSIEGIKVIEQNFKNEINIGNLSSGVYFIKLGSVIKKFMKY